MIREGSKVYVLDDDVSFVRSTVRLLESWGYGADGFTSPDTFLAREPVDGPACALVDVRMPGMNGLEVQRALATSRRKLPVVFVSGHADVKAGVEAIKAGAVDFLSKPVDERSLLDAVQRALVADASAQAARGRSINVRQNLERLTPQERQICRLVVTGLRDDQIAERLGSTAGTVRAARVHAMNVLSTTSLVGMVRLLDAAEAE